MTLPAPVAKTVSYSFDHLGRTFTDAYHWLEDKNDPAVIAYLEAENAYAQTALQPTRDLQETLYQEMLGRMAQDDSSAPDRHGGFEYYSRVQTGKQYRIYCRRAGTEGAEEVLVDENMLAEGREYCKVYRLEASPDQRYAAYAVDFTGAWVFELFVKDLHTGQVVSGPIPNVAWSFAWASDSRTLFYTIFDDAHRAYKVFRHIVGEPHTSDVEVLHEADDAFFLDIERVRSGAYLVSTSQSFSTTEVRFISADQPTAAFRLVAPRRTNHEYFVSHHGDHFLIVSNEDAINFRVLKAPVNQPEPEHWQELLPHRPDVLVESLDAFQDHLVIYERQDGFHQLRLSAPDGLTNVRYIAFPEPVYAVRKGQNLDFATDTLRFVYSSFVTPESSIDYDMARGGWQVVKQQEIPSGYDASLYQSERLMATASDGTQVPLSLVYRTDRRRSGAQPAVLYGYGSYGFSSEVTFNANRISLLDRGFIWATAHIRGGSEMGRPWYEAGRLMHKKNTFSDFIACAEHLTACGYTQPQQLGIMGGSAGGLLVTAVTNMRPELFSAVIALVPFTNVITAMLRPDLPLTVSEYEQWGHPDDPAAFDYMLSYSPYNCIEAKDYPAIYIKAGLTDLQVPFWDPAKYTAKLRATKTDAQPLLLVTKMSAGHSGASGRYDQLRETAEIYAFLIDRLNGA